MMVSGWHGAIKMIFSLLLSGSAGIFSIVLLLNLISPALAEKKVALVIGNSEYVNVQALRNPANDARAISSLFTTFGFDVHLVLNADRSELAAAIGDFSQASRGADAAVFYYAGHGISLDDRNYLIPVDSKIERASDIKFGGGVDAEAAIAEALTDAKIKLVFLDACRDNPFIEEIKRSLGSTRSAAVTRGLSEMTSSEGTLIAFSTAPGNVALDGSGDTSPFASALLKHLPEPGLEIRLAMTMVRADVDAETSGKQVPWESTNLTGFYYFRPAPPSDFNELGVDQKDNLQEPKQNTSDAEIEFWRNVKESRNVVLLESYLIKFPNGIFRPIAEELLREIKNIPAHGNSEQQETDGFKVIDGSAIDAVSQTKNATKKPEVSKKSSKASIAVPLKSQRNRKSKSSPSTPSSSVSAPSKNSPKTAVSLPASPSKNVSQKKKCRTSLSRNARNHSLGGNSSCTPP